MKPMKGLHNDRKSQAQYSPNNNSIGLCSGESIVALTNKIEQSFLHLSSLAPTTPQFQHELKILEQLHAELQSIFSPPTISLSSLFSQSGINSKPTELCNEQSIVALTNKFQQLSSHLYFNRHSPSTPALLQTLHEVIDHYSSLSNDILPSSPYSSSLSSSTVQGDINSKANHPPAPLGKVYISQPISDECMKRYKEAMDFTQHITTPFPDHFLEDNSEAEITTDAVFLNWGAQPEHALTGYDAWLPKLDGMYKDVMDKIPTFTALWDDAVDVKKEEPVCLLGDWLDNIRENMHNPIAHPKVCTGCGHIEGETIGTYLACCPDNNHVDLTDYISAMNQDSYEKGMKIVQLHNEITCLSSQLDAQLSENRIFGRIAGELSNGEILVRSKVDGEPITMYGHQLTLRMMNDIGAIRLENPDGWSIELDKLRDYVKGKENYKLRLERIGA